MLVRCAKCGTKYDFDGENKCPECDNINIRVLNDDDCSYYHTEPEYPSADYRDYDPSDVGYGDYVPTW